MENRQDEPNEKFTFSTISCDFLLRDLEKWCKCTMRRVPVSNNLKTTQAYYSLGFMACLREVERMVVKAKSNKE